ncbi:thioredoxin [Reticulomyxa filosa]|uniref:Thioredoxin n=1 Tax=Reticulomyxa filosa TaxID=46433 RepID=X6P018_RETFI|nr:thioredoxin [Reticulomyxa filosa]|eukprot:ETO31483.1 thioredoxin [Reticulomyxa filosa]
MNIIAVTKIKLTDLHHTLALNDQILQLLNYWFCLIIFFGHKNILKMPIICIGPVCVPITAILPILLLVLRPIYDRLPKTWQDTIDHNVKSAQKGLNHLIRKFGFGNKQSKPNEATQETSKPTTIDNGSGTETQNKKEPEASGNEPRDVITELSSEKEWAETLADKLANDNKDKARVKKIDIGKFDDLAVELGVSALPTYHLYKQGKLIKSISGADSDLVQFFQEL